jgi:hypothetical protein
MRYSTRKTFLPLLCCIATAIAIAKSIQIPMAVADPPSTRPTTQPANEPAANAPMRRWFARLADPDPKVRDQAKIDLMGLPAADLPKLRQLVIDQQPILPGQASALHDIVVQAFLAGESYESLSGDQTTITGKGPQYFLGIGWPNDFDDDETRIGVIVDERVPGFPSYRYLRTGDMILGIYLDPSLSLQQPPNTETHTRQKLIDTIKLQSDQQDIVLLILREGEQKRIAIKLAPRPLAARESLDPQPLIDFKADRADRADKYWQENFVPLLEERDAGEITE